jgi:hypothetical protein
LETFDNIDYSTSDKEKNIKKEKNDIIETPDIKDPIEEALLHEEKLITYSLIMLKQ